MTNELIIAGAVVALILALVAAVYFSARSSGAKKQATKDALASEKQDASAAQDLSRVAAAAQENLDDQKVIDRFKNGSF